MSVWMNTIAQIRTPRLSQMLYSGVCLQSLHAVSSHCWAKLFEQSIVGTVISAEQQMRSCGQHAKGRQTKPEVPWNTKNFLFFVDKNALDNSVQQMLHFLAKLRQCAPPNPPNRHTYTFFVQPWQNLSKLNYVAICWVFDVINLKPCWNVHRLEGLWATINAVMLYERTPP